MTDILKRKDFARWQSGEKLSDAALCKFRRWRVV